MKKKWNKIAVLAMIVVMAFAGAACKKEEPVTVKKDKKPTEAVEDKDKTSDKDETPTKPADETPTQPAEPTQPAKQDTDGEGNGTGADKGAHLFGYIEGDRYINEYMGFSCGTGEPWKFATAEQLQELPKSVEEFYEGTDLGDAISAATYFFDMQAENTQEMESMNINYQKLTIQERLTYGNMTSEEIIDAVLTSKDVMIANYKANGINVGEMYKKKVDFCGKECVAMCMDADINGVPYYTLQVFYYNLGEYAATLTLCSYHENKTEDMATMFSSLK